MLEVYETECKGRGVFTSEDIDEDALVESSPVILLSPETGDDELELVGLSDYPYSFDNRTALALGFGSLFNHSDDPNLTWDINEENHTIDYHAVCSIEAGEELTIDYGTEPWFDIED